MGAYAATLGSTILVFARVLDAVNDPIEGWIIDRAKPGKNGKYRSFTLLSILLMTVGVILMFWIPTAIIDNKIMVSTYIIVAYLMYDIGVSFFVPELIYRTITLDGEARGTLLIGPRMVVMGWGIVCSALITILSTF